MRDVEKLAPTRRGAKPRQPMQKHTLNASRLGKRFNVALAKPAGREIGAIMALKPFGACGPRAAVQVQGRPHGDAPPLCNGPGRIGLNRDSAESVGDIGPLLGRKIAADFKREVGLGDVQNLNSPWSGERVRAV
jgi:hypothetical protein